MPVHRAIRVLLLFPAVVRAACEPTEILRTIEVGPNDYQAAVHAAMAGDRIRLLPGTYPNGLSVYGLQGEPGRCIVVEGPGAVLLGDPGRSRNTVQIRNSQYVVLRDFELDGQGAGVHALVVQNQTALGYATPYAHHLRIEDLYIHDYDWNAQSDQGLRQQMVGISTKAPVWNTVIRRNRIERVGTGLYLGDSDGRQEFVNGSIEKNLVRDTLGYAMQIKHQVERNTQLGIPAQARTRIRHNVFAKFRDSNGGANARPSLLLGAFPASGPGSDDDYLISGNLFWQNDTGSEALIQATGNINVYGNLLVNDFGDGIRIQAHEGSAPRRINLFFNTVLVSGTGLFVSGTGVPGFQRHVRGNAVFAATPINGGSQQENFTAARIDATLHLHAPQLPVGSGLDLAPLPGALLGSVVNVKPIDAFDGADRDFDGWPRMPERRGAYVCARSLWSPQLDQPPSVDGIFSDGLGDRC